MEAGTGLVDDLATLSTLDEESLLDEIRVRYDRNIIYTYIGDILIAVNPYKPLSIYGYEIGALYSRSELRAQNPPHLYAVSAACLTDLKVTRANQCCVVSGESGAGKTESTKLMIEHICQQSTSGGDGLAQRIIQVNPLLEAFGNAQTVMNNNSSRFGKFIELQFGNDGHIHGAHINEYLLEKSRIVSHGAEEKNFHVFYYLFAGLDEDQLRNNLLNRPEDHRILRCLDGSPVYPTSAAFSTCRRMWDSLTHTMVSVGFSQEDMNGVLAMLAAVLLLTDVVFAEDEEVEGVYVVQEAGLEMAAQLLAVRPEELATALISNVHVLRGERIVNLKNVSQANDGRDALAKALYGRLFGWMVRQINLLLRPQDRNHKGSWIGLLDIAGFEDFHDNSFEQLCINAANEQLQFYFTQHVFTWELDEYKREGVKGKDIKFTDNRGVLDLFMETPVGLFSLLDEESRFPRASDATFLEKIQKHLGKKPQLSRNKGHNMFTIQHYAGPVHYIVTGFLEKNRDTLSWNLLDCMKNSESQFVTDLFFAQISATGSLLRNESAPKRSRKSLLMCKAPELSTANGKSLSKMAGKKLRKELRAKTAEEKIYENAARTLANSFRNSLTDLMAKLLDSQPHFVRCLKPNADKRPGLFVQSMVKDQLRYTGVLDTVRIRRQGYATRIPFTTFIKRYQIIAFPLTSQVTANEKSCAKICKKAGIKEWECGKTKVFLKYWHPESLSRHLATIYRRVIDCQRVVRGWLARRMVARGWRNTHSQFKEAMSLCALVSSLSDNQYFLQTRLIDEDAQRFNQIAREREENIKAAQAKLRPPSERDNKGEKKGRKTKLYQPTPIILGNPYTGNPDPLTADPNRASQRAKSPNPQSHRSENQSGQNMASYQHNGGGEFMWMESRGTSQLQTRHIDETPVYNHPPQGRHIDATPVYNLPPQTKPKPTHNPLAAANKPAHTFNMSLLDETLQKFADLDQEVWCKLVYCEKNNVVGKLYVREKEVMVDESTTPFDGKTLGLRSMNSSKRDSNTAKIIKKIGKGVRLSRDASGNIYATRLSDGDVICKGYNTPEASCLGEEIIACMGRLPKGKSVQIFSMTEYKSHIALELQKPMIDQRRLQALSMCAIAFGRNSLNDLDTPCWLTIVNLCALDVLGNDRVLQEVKSLAHLNLSDVDDAQLRRNWARLHQRRDLVGRTANNRDQPPYTHQQIGERQTGPEPSQYTLQKYQHTMSNSKGALDELVPTNKKNWAKLKVVGRDGM